jgi:hypothetical protein
VWLARRPFGVGESAVYEVRWVGFGAGVPAGTVEFAVLPPEPGSGAAFTIDLTATTARWVSAIFDARDRFWTTSTADLFPLVHRQQLKEGRRRVSRTVRFDRVTGLVRVGDGDLTSPADGISRPSTPGIRDPLTAMYYVRSLDWSRRDRTSVLVSDIGFELDVALTAASALVTVEAEGRPQRARRIGVQMKYRRAAFPVPNAAVWLSADARQIPLAAAVDTDVGAFELSLVRYTPGAPARATGR